MPLHLRALAGTVLTCALGAGSVVVCTPAVAAPTLRFSAIGDVTGDGRKDRVALADLGTSAAARCVAVVRAGRSDGGFDAPRTVTLVTPENEDPSRIQQCPSLGVVSTAPSPSGNLLLAVYVNSVDGRATGVYSLTGQTLASGQAPLRSAFGGGYLSAGVGVLDFDGDGTGDFWRQGTDEGDGSAMWQRRGTSFARIYDTGPNPGVYFAGSGLQFVDLNRAGGTDALASTISNGTVPAFAAVVDGRTGAVQTLATGGVSDGVYVVGFRISTVDLDHDLYPDVAVTPISDEQGDLPPRYFLNHSQGGRWSFAALPVRAVAPVD